MTWIVALGAFGLGFACGGWAVFVRVHTDFIEAARQAGADPHRFREYLQENTEWWG